MYTLAFLMICVIVAAVSMSRHERKDVLALVSRTSAADRLLVSAALKVAADGGSVWLPRSENNAVVLNGQAFSASRKAQMQIESALAEQKLDQDRRILMNLSK